MPISNNPEEKIKAKGNKQSIGKCQACSVGYLDHLIDLSFFKVSLHIYRDKSKNK